MLKKSIITVLCIALMAGSVNFRVYAEELIIEEDISSEYELPSEAELLADEVSIKGFSIKAIPPIKLWSGIIPEYEVILSSGNAVIYPYEKRGYAGDNDVIISLSTEEKGIISVDGTNNSVHGWKTGVEQLTATACLKKDLKSPEDLEADEGDKFTATINVTVNYPVGEIVSEYGSERKSISFDGETEYSGWVMPISGGKYSKCDGIVSGGSYFLSEGDAIDCPLSEDESGRIAVSGRQIGSLACNCAVWIQESDRYRLYKFDENGVLLKNDLWHRMKGISVDPFEESRITLTEGEKRTFTVDFIPEITDDPALDELDINDDKCVCVTSSDSDRVEVSEVIYEYDKNHNDDNTISRCSFEICALTAMSSEEPDVEIVITSGDSDNKYCEDNKKIIKVRTLYAEGFKLIGGEMQYKHKIDEESWESWEGWYPNNDEPKYYFFTKDDEEAGFGTCYTQAKGFVWIKNGDNKEYYRFGADGTYIGEAEGFQTIDGAKYYFLNKSEYAVGVREIDGKKYLFNEDGQQLFNGYYTVKDLSYLVNKKGEVVTGWQKVKVSGVTDWHFFSLLTGAEIEPENVSQEGKSFWRSIKENDITVDYYFPNNGTPYVAKRNEKGKAVKSSIMVNTGDKNYYIDAKGNTYKGWIKLTVDGVTDWHYFSKSTGEEMGPSDVRLESDGKSKWRTVGDDVFYFPLDKSVTKGFKNGYYFDSVYGNMLKGKVLVKGKTYLTDSDTGKILKSFYGDWDDGRYLTNSAGVLLTGWQKIKISGVTEWHYFDEASFKEASIDEWLDTDGKSYWRKAYGNTYYFPKNTSLAKGFKDIRDESGKKHTYFFDKVTGKLMSGQITVGSTGYYLDSTGEKITSKFVKVNENYLYLNKSGVVAKKWITVNGKKYYADPSTGNLSIGFEKIGRNMYYFNETEANAGQMMTGFFKVPPIGQKYYDPNGSNMYYADKNGVITPGGWKIIKYNEKIKDSQAWSYYFNPSSNMVTKKGDLITGEVVTGDAVINDDGSVAKYVEGDKSHMYSFDEKTGARKKAVLYFHGGGYTESLMSIDQRAQLNTMLSLAQYMNTDRKLSSPSDMMILAGYSDLSGYGITMPGNVFPLASDYKAEFDVAKYDAANDKYVEGQDGAIDIGDIEAYSFDLYTQVIDRFGTNNVILMGASSGGAIALSILEKAGIEGVAQPSETILYSPWLDATMDNPKSKKYSSRGVDYGMLVSRAQKVTREGNGGPGTHSKAAWFASPALKSNGCTFEGVKNVTIYAGTNDPCYPDVADFVNNHKKMVKLVKSSAGHGYMFDKGGSTIQNTAKAIMTQGK